MTHETPESEAVTDAAASATVGGSEDLFRTSDELATVLRRIGDGVTVQDRAGRLVYANDAAARLIGFDSAAELLATPVAELLDRFELLDEERRPFPFDRLPGRLTIASGEPEAATVCYRIRATGDERWSMVRATPIVGPDGRPTHAVNVFHDVTASRIEEDRTRLLAEATSLLTRSLDLGDALEEIGRLVVPPFADYCLLDVADDDGSLRRRVSVHADPGQQRVLRDLSRSSRHPAATAHAEGRPVLVRQVSSRDVHGWFAWEDEKDDLPGRLGLRSLLAVPLVVRGRTLGVLTLGTDASGRRLREGDLVLARELGSRVAAALDNERLYAASRESERRVSFLAQAGEILASSLDYERTLAGVARLAVPELADWCAVDIVANEGRIERLAVAHVDPEKARWAEELSRRTPPDPEGLTGVPLAIRTGESQLLPEIPQEVLEAAVADRPELAETLANLGFLSSMIVPLRGRARTLGAIVFATSRESGRRLGEPDLRMAEELSRRAATAIENARLFREAERRADAARALQFIGDGVLLVDGESSVRVWNPAAEAITGRAQADVLGRPLAEVLPELAALPAGASARVRPSTLPVDLEGEERWLSVARAGFADGAVFTFRDVTEERRLDQLKDDFVATVSHQLRTPVTAVYGAARTLARDDIEIEPAAREQLFDLIQKGTVRLAGIVDDILIAGQLEAGTIAVAIESCDPRELVERAVEAMNVTLPDSVDLEHEIAGGTPAVAVDPAKLEQVLANLLENAVKYSPDGGRVVVRVREVNGRVRFAVEDEGLGIPPAERERVFDKFYRLDPQLTRGVGGTGLGLYVCRQLVERMGGTAWIEGRDGPGSLVAFDLPAA